MAAPGAALIRDNLSAVRERIDSAGGRGITVVAVTKTHPWEVLVAAAEAGCDAIGENYVQEIVAKLDGRTPPAPLHMIGSIQSNKVRKIDSVVSLWESVDRRSVVEEIGRRGRSGGCTDVLLQVNITGEESKGGCAPAGLQELMEAAATAGVRVHGLMGIGPTAGSATDTESAFRLLRRLCDENGLGVCSMGMSGDFEIAAACGSTMIRVGSVLFGARP